jgi:hypothetical protein
MARPIPNPESKENKIKTGNHGKAAGESERASEFITLEATGSRDVSGQHEGNELDPTKVTKPDQLPKR